MRTTGQKIPLTVVTSTVSSLLLSLSSLSQSLRFCKKAICDLQRNLPYFALLFLDKIMGVETQQKQSEVGVLQLTIQPSYQRPIEEAACGACMCLWILERVHFPPRAQFDF